MDLLEHVDPAVKAFMESDRPIEFTLDPVLTVGLIGQLQLAFRHPANNGPTRQSLECFVRDLIEKLDPDHGNVHDFLMMGFDPEHDA